MDKVCRLCCSTTFVSNYIFDEETALYLKMSLYLPIKVFKNDRLPQHICDRCSCKVNDIYQFCNETIEAQNRLRRSLVIANKDIIPEDSVDLTLIKDSVDSPLIAENIEAPLITDTNIPLTENSVDIPLIKGNVHSPPHLPELQAILNYHHQCTQTDFEDFKPTQTTTSNQATSMEIKVKMEPIEHDPTPHQVKMEYTDLPSYNNSDSDDMLLINFQKKKPKRKPKLKKGKVNGEGPKKPVKQEFETVMEIEELPEGSFAFDDDTPFELRLQMMKDEDWMDEMIEKKQQLEEKKDYFCCVCMKECKYKTQMLNHYEKHMKDFGTPAKYVAPAMPKERPLKCNRCCRVVVESEWAEHWWRHWEKDHRPLRCALCRYTFRRPLAALKHCLSHTRAEAEAVAAAMAASANDPRFGCDLCELTFSTKREVLSHRTVSHPAALGAALALRCSECSRTFAHGTSLRRHMRAHRGVREHLCNICGKALSSREHLKFHIRIHTGYKPNVCKTCGKGFVKKCNLTLHERVHSGEKPHVCPVCGKAFSQRSTLVIHERYHTGARPYVCNLCGRGFVAQGLLSMHLKTTCI